MSGDRRDREAWPCLRFATREWRQWTKKPLFVPLRDDLRQGARLAGLARHDLAGPALVAGSNRKMPYSSSFEKTTIDMTVLVDIDVAEADDLLAVLGDRARRPSAGAG